MLNFGANLEKLQGSVKTAIICKIACRYNEKYDKKLSTFVSTLPTYWRTGLGRRSTEVALGLLTQQPRVQILMLPKPFHWIFCVKSFEEQWQSKEKRWAPIGTNSIVVTSLQNFIVLAHGQKKRALEWEEWSHNYFKVFWCCWPNTTRQSCCVIDVWGLLLKKCTRSYTMFGLGTLCSVLKSFLRCFIQALIAK